jgi:hypothetical protein
MTENKSRLDPSVWFSTDGHLHTSISTAVPEKWTPAETGGSVTNAPMLAYVSGDYVIKRHPYGSRFTYALHRNRVPIGLGYSRLKDAKEHAVRNARGEDTVNVA